MRVLKLFAVVVASLSLQACVTLFGGDDAPKLTKLEVAQDALESEKTRTQNLELELSRVKAENARLANQVLRLQRDRDSDQIAAAPSEPEISDGQDVNDVLASLLPQDTQQQLREDPAAIVAPNAPRQLDQIGAESVPVEQAPRLVQPTFTSSADVFENEAPTHSPMDQDLFGVHLASYRAADEARAGWQRLQRKYPSELGLLEPRLERVEIEGKGEFLRLVGGGFTSRDKAAALCQSLKQRGIYCSVSGFVGERLVSQS